jgi:hypothetical protein
MLGEDRRIWWLACLHFTRSNRIPSVCALHFGVPRHIDEASACERILALAHHFDLDASAWQRIKSEHHFVTFQRRNGKPRITTYFLPS